MTDQLMAAALDAVQVLIVCLILGAGLPALFALGLGNLATARGVAGVKTRFAPGVHRAIAYLLFAVVVLAVLLGLSFILAHGLGFKISFHNLIPIIGG